MKSKIWSTLFVYFLLISCYIPPAFPWGNNAHERMTEVACDSLPSEIAPFFDKHRREVADHSNDPDRWRRTLLFWIGLKYEDDLNNGKVTADLRQVFETHRIDFPQDAPVSLRGKNGRWFITIGEQEYPIRKETDKLYLIDFPQDAPVSLRGKNGRWFITIGEQEYLIRKEADKLYLEDKTNIFENRSAATVLLGSEEDIHFVLDTKEKLLSLTRLNVYKTGDRAEGPRHFLDIDIYGPYPFVELPHDYDDAVAKFGVETVTKRGIATWRIAEYTQLLSEAMKSGDTQKIVQTAGALAHYVEDIHMPLHVVKNYNGQLTNQHGVHQRFEDDMVDTYAERIHLTPKMASEIEDPLEAAFDIVLDSYVYADDLLHADRKAKLGEDTYGASYLEKLFRFSGRIAEQRMSDAAIATASYWYTAWLRAGKPELR